MAFQQSDIDTLKAAIATGAREVAYADGRRVSYRTLPEMKQTLAMIEAEVAGTDTNSLKANRVVIGVKSDITRGPPVSPWGGSGGWGRW